MCVIIVKPQNSRVKYKVLEKCFARNPDGAGIMFPKDGKVVIVKGMMAWEEYREKIQKLNTIYKLTELPVVFHFRIKSVGEKTAQYTHPFRISPSLAYCHNGTIIKIKTNKKGESDTSAFNRLILRRLRDDVFNSQAIKYLIEGYIGTDKMVFMNGKGDIIIFNEKAGTQRGKLWFSNCSWEYEPPAQRYAPVNYANYGLARKGKQLESCITCGADVYDRPVSISQNGLFCSPCYQHLNFIVMRSICTVRDDLADSTIPVCYEF